MLALKEALERDVTMEKSPILSAPERPAPSAFARDRANRLSLELYEAVEPLEAEWSALERDPLNSLHQSRSWCRAWAETHGSQLAIVRGERDGRTLFLLPLEIRAGRLARTARFIGDDFSNLNTGLIAPAFRRADALADATSFTTALGELLAGRADFAALTNLPRVWRGEENPFAALGAVENHNRSYQLPLRGDMEETIKQVNARRRRKKFRNQQRLLEAMGGYEHVIAETPQERAAILDLFFKQKATRFAAQGVPDAFRDAPARAFFHALAQTGPEGGDMPLQLHALRLKGADYGGHIAAITGLSLQGDHVICQFGSIDETHALQASPGEFLFWLAIEHCVVNGYALFDFGVGDQPYKKSWCPDNTPMHDLFLPLNLRGQAARAVALGIVNAKAFIKRHRGLYDAIQRLRSGSAPKDKSEDQAA